MPTVEKNIEILKSFKDLKHNWNSYDAKPFSHKLIHQAIQLIQSWEYQPSIFPTANQSIQMEYESEGVGYLEFELFENRIELFVIDNHKKEHHYRFSYDSEEIYQHVVAFHQK